MLREDGSKFVVFALVVLTFFCGETSSECTQLTHCSCMFPDGQGYNLTKLATSGPFMSPLINNHTFYFNPCMNVPMTKNASSACHLGKGVSMCLVEGNKSTNLGTVEETIMEVSPETIKHPSLVLRHENYTTTVQLLCCEKCLTHLTELDTMDKLNYRLLLESPAVCKEQLRSNSGLSIGSLLLIYFFVFTGLYFIVGAIVINLLRGATGWEMVPNHNFWRDLPSLVRDGIEYTFSCCYGTSYDRI